MGEQTSIASVIHEAGAYRDDTRPLSKRQLSGALRAAIAIAGAIVSGLGGNEDEPSDTRCRRGFLQSQRTYDVHRDTGLLGGAMRRNCKVDDRVETFERRAVRNIWQHQLVPIATGDTGRTGPLARQKVRTSNPASRATCTKRDPMNPRAPVTPRRRAAGISQILAIGTEADEMRRVVSGDSQRVEQIQVVRHDRIAFDASGLGVVIVVDAAIANREPAHRLGTGDVSSAEIPDVGDFS